MAIAQSMITECNKRLAMAVSKKDMNEIATANALTESAQKRFDSIQKSITSVQERHTNFQESGRNTKTMKRNKKL